MRRQFFTAVAVAVVVLFVQVAEAQAQARRGGSGGGEGARSECRRLARAQVPERGRAAEARREAAFNECMARRRR